MPQSRDDIIAACESYIFDGLRDQKPDKVRLAEHCVRTELGMVTGRDAEHLRRVLGSYVYDCVLECYDLNWVVEGDQACVFYKQKLTFTDLPCLIATRFKIVDGLLEEIEVLEYNHGMMDSSAEVVAELSNL